MQTEELQPNNADEIKGVDLTPANIDLIKRTKDPYRLNCPSPICNSKLQLHLPNVHCPRCHHVWMAKALKTPARCPVCAFNLFRWRAQIGVQPSNLASVIAAQ